MSNIVRYLRVVVSAVALSALIVGCGGGGGSTGTTSTVQAAITDAPSSDFDHVWITIAAIWFHTDTSAGPNQPGWIKYSLPSPVTLDLTTLSNGQLSHVFQNISLAAGNYQQMRLLLVPTEDALAASASAAGLSYNNQVEYTDTNGVHDVRLRIPSPLQGIKLAGNFQVAGGGTLNIAIDFDIGHQVLKYDRGTGTSTVTEFILKPALAYFDLDNAGAIVGQIDSSTLTGGGYNFVIKAEELSGDGTYHVVTRATTVDSTGKFILYPLPVAAGTTKSYDIVLRGRNVETYIVKNVPVVAGTTPTNGATIVPSITMNSGSEFTANYTTAVNPTGAWTSFFQTIPGDTASYHIRYRHLDPFTGVFYDAIPLSMGQLHWGAYNGGQPISFTAVTPQQKASTFDMVVNALFYTRTPNGTVTGTTNTLSSLNPPTPLAPLSPANPDSISGTITVSSSGLDTAYMIVVRDGIIVTTQSVSSSLTSGGAFTLSNLPGGTSSTIIPGAYYTLYLVAWNSTSPLTSFTAAASSVIDLTQGSANGIALTLQ